ncbi:MAG: matrixin family metalloprotease [Fibrella sp.]|nr:matrixin family metalloprotease [Armatimonadota bacterium]
MPMKKIVNPNNITSKYTWGLVAVTVQLIGSFTLMSGCGGGGGGGTIPSPVSTPTPAPLPTSTPTPVPTPAPTPTPISDARERAVAANFLPNYIPVNPERYLHWANNKSIRVFVHPSVNNVVNKTPVNNIDPARAQNAVREALDFWTAASTNDFQFSLVSREEDADIEIYFVDELRDLKGNNPVGVGMANFSFTFPNSDDEIHGVLTNAVTQILASQPAANLTDTIAHEIGHTLGIEKHSEDSSDLLFATSLPPTIITQRDQNTLFFLYYSPTAVVSGRSVTTDSGRSLPVRTGEIACGVN